MIFSEYPEERLRIASIHSRLTEDERTVRRALMEAIVDAGAPVSVSCVRSAVPFDDERFAAAERGLDEKRFIVRGSDNDVCFVYPVSGVSTAHRVTLADGRSFHAMCAIDALGSTFTLEQDTTIVSTCSQCGEPIRVAVSDGAIKSSHPATIRAVHADLNKAENWAGSC